MNEWDVQYLQLNTSPLQPSIANAQPFQINDQYHKLNIYSYDFNQCQLKDSFHSHILPATSNCQGAGAET